MQILSISLKSSQMYLITKYFNDYENFSRNILQKLPFLKICINVKIFQDIS